MPERNYEYFGIGMRIDHLLKGFDDGFFDPIRSTEFKWTESFGPRNPGELQWIRNSISSWLNAINKSSGVTVLNYEFKGSYNSCDSGTKFKYWEVTFEFAIQGAFKANLLHPTVAKHFSGFFKKFLAEELLRRFPLPFSHNEALFKSGIVDMYILKPSRTHQEELDKFGSIVHSEIFQTRLEKMITDNFPANLSCIRDLKTKSTRYWLCHSIFVKWQVDVDDSMRFKLREELDSLLCAMGAKYTYDNRDNAFFRVYYER